jgi:hypothetical protein
MAALLLSLGCQSTDPSPSPSADDDGTASSTGMHATSTVEPSTGAVDSQTSTGSASGDTTGDASEDTGEDEPELCGVTDSGDTPWFEVRHLGTDLEDGASLHLECGPQGAFMLEFRVALGGFVPDSDIVSFAITISVEGFDIGPGGYFYTTQNYPVFVGCEDEDILGLPSQNYIRIFPPDELADLAQMDGAAVTMSAVMKAGDEEVPFEMTGTMDAAEDRSWGCCYDFERCF